MTPTPGTNAIVEITTQLLSTDVPKDWCTTHLTFNTGAPSPTAANWQAFTDAIKSVWFATSGTNAHYGSNGGKVIAYNRADPIPRPEKAVSLYTPGSWASSVNDRVCSLCVSFYCFRNLKRLRGRVYMPPNVNISPVNERPGTANMNNCMGTIKAINSAVFALTPSWQQSVHTAVDNTDNIVDHYWVNDTWDHQRRRGPKETTRVTATFP